MIEQLERVETKRKVLNKGSVPEMAPPAKVYKPQVKQRIAKLEEDDEESFLQRNRVGLIIGGMAVIGVSWIAFHYTSGPSAPVHRAPEMSIVRIQLPPPPPPPPPKVQPPPPKDEKPSEQAPMAKPEQKPEAAKPKPLDKPPEGLGTNIKGPGQGVAGLGGSGNGMIGGTGNGPGGGSAGAWYAGQVQSRIAEALRNHRKTRNASINGLKFAVSLNGNGRVTGIDLQGSTGDPALDNAIRAEILPGLQLSEPPPEGKPMRVTMKLTARRPN